MSEDANVPAEVAHRKSTPGGRSIRLAWLAAAIVVVALSGLTLVSSVVTGRATRAAQSALHTAQAYQHAADAMSAEESARQRYAARPSPAVRAEFAHASTDAAAALALANRDAGATPAVARLATSHDAYVQAAGEQLAAIDGGNAAAAALLQTTAVDPAYRQARDLVTQAATAHRQAAVDGLAKARARQSLVERAAPIAVGAGLVLVALLPLLLRRYRRRLADEQRRALHASWHDTLTGLPNRQLLAERVHHALRTAQAGRYQTAVVLLDVDRLSEINRVFGHQFGNRLLGRIGPRLAAALRPTDTVARVGGDEFAVLLPDVTDEASALELADRLRRAIEAPLTLHGVEVSVSAGAGVVISDDQGDDPATMLQRAEAALFLAKQRTGRVALYQPGEADHDPGGVVLVGELRRAIDAGELELHYQPKVAVGSGAVRGVEALVRWRHEQRGLIQPADFVPLAGHTNLIGPLTRYVLNAALAQTRRWADTGRPLPVSVNLAAADLADPTLGDDVLRLLQEHGVPAEWLCLELTENAVAGQPERAAALMHRLHAAGVTFALDDVGTGRLSLAQLTGLPLSELKVDRSFVGRMTTDRASNLVVRTVIDLGAKLGLTTVAEGVEDVATLAALTNRGCHTAQGFLLCEPVPAEEFDAWYRREHADPRAA